MNNWKITALAASLRGPLPAGGEPPSAGSAEAAGLPERVRGPSIAQGKFDLYLVKKKTVEVTSVSICKMFKTHLTCFIQQLCVKRQKSVLSEKSDEYCYRQRGGFLLERRIKRDVLYPLKQEEREKGRER